MDARVDNGQDAAPAERKRSNAISLSAPEVSAKAGADAPASRGSPGPAPPDIAPADDRTYSVIIPPMGESAVIGTALQGYTLIHMTNLGDGEADVSLTWIGRNGPQLGQMFTNRRMGFEFYRDLFHGAKVAITNLSAESSVRIRVTLCP